MGFYGNISSASRSSFQFDKIYRNRHEMDLNAANDGIFIGRYVLVDYDQEASIADIKNAVGEGSDVGNIVNQIKTITNTKSKVVFGYRGYERVENEESGEFIDEPLDPIVFYSGLSTDYPYVIVDNPSNSNELSNGDFIVDIGKVITYQYVDGEIITETITEVIEDKKYFQLYIATNDGFVLATDANAENLVNNKYLTNYQEDSNVYASTGRGYDSTVWQKTYKDGNVKYVMVAELNSVVPSFDLTVDAPTPVPLKPHFDTDSSNVYYKIHLQPSWGLRVKGAKKDDDFSDGKQLPSDEKGDYYTGNTIIANPEDDNYINHHTVIPESIPNTDLAIYFNKAGFNRFVEQDAQYSKDEITVLPTGKSLNDYYVTKNGDTYGKSEDTYELSMMLPSIGASISDFWNIVYGPGTYKDSNGNYLWDKTTQKFAHEATQTEPAFKVRNTSLEWNTTEGRRAVKQVGNSYTYDMEDLNTVAGVVNSLHDLMGMIIRTSSTINNVNNWDADKIYFVPDNPNDINKTGATGKYYYKQKTYEYREIIGNNDTPVYYDVENIVDLLPFTSEENESTGKVIAQYFKRSEEQYDSYKDFYETDTPVDERVIYNYNNYYAVKNDADIDLSGVYGKLELEKPTDLNPENYTVVEDEDGLLSAEVYYKDEDNPIETYILAQETKPTHNTYYKINFKKVDKNEQKLFYAKNSFWLGTKYFTSLEEKAAWVSNFNGNEIGPIISNNASDGFDSLSPCVQNGTEAWLSNLKAENENNSILKYYAFYQGVEIDPKNTKYEYIDENLKSGSVIMTSVGNEVPENSGYYKLDDTYHYKAKKAGKDEILTSAREHDGYLEFQCGQYLNQKSGKIDPEDLDNKLYTLMEWEESAVSENDMELTQIMALKRVVARPAYTFEDAVFIPIDSITIAEDGNTGYWFRANLGPNVIGYQQETITTLGTDNGRDRRDQGKWYEIEGDIDILVYYHLDGEYYYKSGDNWIRETATMLRSDTDIGKYYKVKQWTPLESGQVPFKKNTYYKMVGGSLQPINAYDSTIDKYYVNKDRYVIEDTNYNLEVGSIWNPNADTPDSSRTGVTLGYRSEKFEARELDGFAKYLNTLHGLILEINKKLLFGDKLTRDVSTVQGAINKLNDIINGFAETLPGNILMVDALGRVHGGDWDTKQKSSTALGTAPAIPTGEPTVTDDERWIKMTTTSGIAENGFKPHIKLEHTFKAGTDTTSASNLNTDNVVSNNDSDKIQLYTPILDNMGHVVANNIETVTLPYGFKIIKTGEDDELIATNTQDIAVFNGDTWIETTASENGVSFTHTGPVTTEHATIANETPNFGSTFTIKDLDFDNKGHKANEGTHTVTIPQPSLTTDGLGNIITGLSLVSSTGAFTQNRTFVGSLNLTGYSVNETNPLITTSDTINGAFKKIETVLDNSNITVNTRINNFKGTSADVNDSTVYGIVNSSKNSLIGNIGDSWDGATPAYTLYGLKDYIDQTIADQLNEGIRFSSHIWGVQAFYNSTENQSISISNQNEDGAIVPISISNGQSLTYGPINGSCEDYAVSLNNSNLTGIKVNESGLYRVQACAAVRTQSASSTLINGIKIWVMKTSIANINNREKIISVTESLENSTTSALNAAYATSSKLIQLNAGDIVYLAVTHVNSPDSSIDILANNDTYILLEKLNGELVQGGE